MLKTKGLLSRIFSKFAMNNDKAQKSFLFIYK